MNKFSKIADGLGSWLIFEQRCGRYPLFCESYLSYPLGQLFQRRFPGRVLTEYKHPILSDRKAGPGRKPSIDFIITGKEKRLDLAVEIKWVSKSPTLARDIVRDIIRLELLLPDFANEAILILAGKVKDLRSLLGNPVLHSQDGKPVLIRDDYPKSAVHFFYRLSEVKRKFYSKVLKGFNDLEVSTTIQLERSGPFPRQTNADQYQIYLWKIKPRGKKFCVNDYEKLSIKQIK